MRLNQFIAHASSLSRRGADKAIKDGQVTVDGQLARPGQEVSEANVITLNQHALKLLVAQTIIMNKPPGYVCSRDGQGSQTIYELLPQEFQQLKPVGRLDKASSGILLLTNNGQLAYELTHPKFQKEKIYKVVLNQPLKTDDRAQVTEGVHLEDGISKLQLTKLHDDTSWQVTMHEGRNRQIRRTFEKLGYRINELHRTSFGDYRLGSLQPGQTVKAS